MTAEEFAQRAGLKRCGRFYRGRCPHRPDSSPSFSMWEESGWIRFKDFATSDDPRSVTQQVLGAMGLRNEDLRTGGPPACFAYRDAGGKPLFSKRKTLADGDKKRFVQLAADGGSSLTHLNGQAKTLYRYPEVRAALKAGNPIHVVEGEKAADALAEAGVTATCQPLGAGRGKWLPQHTAALQGAADVVIWADRDQVGADYAAEVYKALKEVAGRVRVVRSQTQGDHDDAFDHLAAGYGLDQAEPATDLMRSGLACTTFGDVFEPATLEFLVEPYLPKGKCVLLDADGGTGKTSLMAAFAGTLSSGVSPITKVPCPPTQVLYLHKGEDDEREIETIARANGARPHAIHYFGGPDLRLDEAGVRLIEATVREQGIGLVVIDALFYFLNGLVDDTNQALPAMAVMERLNALAARTGVSIVNIRHTTKGQLGKQASELGMGSVQFRNSHRGQLVARWHPDRKGMSGVVVVTDEKGSLLVERGPAFAYRRVGHEVQILRNFENPFDSAGDTRPKLQKAVEYLKERLDGCFLESATLEAEVLALGIGKTTYDEARRVAGVVGKRYTLGGPWVSCIPSTVAGAYNPWSEE